MWQLTVPIALWLWGGYLPACAEKVGTGTEKPFGSSRPLDMAPYITTRCSIQPRWLPVETLFEASRGCGENDDEWGKVPQVWWFQDVFSPQPCSLMLPCWWRHTHIHTHTHTHTLHFTFRINCIMCVVSSLFHTAKLSILLSCKVEMFVYSVTCTIYVLYTLFDPEWSIQVRTKEQRVTHLWRFTLCSIISD